MMKEGVLEAAPGMGGLLFKAATKKGQKLAVGDSIPKLEAGLRQVRFLPKQLREYATLVGAPDSEYMPLVAPHILAAPLHLHLLTQAECPLKAMGLIHLRNSVEVIKPIARHQPMDIHVTIGETTWVHKGLEVDVKTEVHVEGEIVWRESSVIFSRQSVAREIPRRDRNTEEVKWSEGSETWALASNLGRRYASVSGDWNPIHLYGWTAKLFGFSRPIIHGMWSFARCMSLFPVGACRLEVEFQRPIELPGKPILNTKIEEDGSTRFQLAREADGKSFLTGMHAPLEER